MKWAGVGSRESGGSVLAIGYGQKEGVEVLGNAVVFDDHEGDEGHMTATRNHRE